MSEKSQSYGKRLRISALVPILFSIIAFVLTILTTVSGSKPGMLENLHSLTLNTSGVGSNLIQFSTASNSSSSSSSNDGSLGGFFSGLFNNITGSISGSISGGIDSTEADLVHELITKLGLSDFYSFHLLTICQGDFSNASNPADVTLEVKKCSKYKDASAGLANVTTNIPSSVNVAGTNVSVPILSTVSSTSGYLNDMASKISAVAFAFFILTIIGTAISIPLFVVAGLRASSPLLNNSSLILSMLTLAVQTIGAIFSTGLLLQSKSTINRFASTIGLQLKLGGPFLAAVWVSFILLLVNTWYWTAIWFVEFRQISYKARRRTPHEIGNWNGIVKEVMSDLRPPKAEETGWATRLDDTQMPISQPRQRRTYGEV